VDWQAVGVLVSSVLAVVAIVVSVVGQRASDAHAKRSADAAERMASALERQSLERERTSDTPGVAWRLEHFNGDTYMLTNVGRAPAYRVHVDTGDISVVRGDMDHNAVDADGWIKFLAVLTLGTTDDTITVTWADSPGGDRTHEWKRPLPPRPPR
jgi:hypothetical protein